MTGIFPRIPVRAILATVLASACAATPILAQTASNTQQQANSSKDAKTRPWMDTSLSATKRADLLLKKMTLAQKLQLTFGYFPTPAPWQKTATKNWKFPQGGIPYSAGFVPGVPHLGIPNQWETDAGLGVATQRSPKPRLRTSLPSGLATAATWNPKLAEAGGAMIGNEAFLSGFNVQLGGGINLMRDPRNGRNFEYAGEDPLLAGTIVGHEIKGVQSNHVISTMKHYALNDQETDRFTIDVKIGKQAARQSDLLAFRFAQQIGDPGAVMCAYNRVNGAYSCQNDWLLNQVLKKSWGFKGYVMTDWGAAHSTTQAANAGLDQESGWAFDRSPYVAGALREAVNNGFVTRQRANNMAHRILWAMFKFGLFDTPVSGDQSKQIDYKAHAAVTQADAEEAIVLLKNKDGLLPLSNKAKSILIVGSHADVGVLSGGGSSQVYPHGAPKNGLIVPDEYPGDFPGPKVYDPSSPMKALQARTHAKVTYRDGKNLQATRAAAKEADIVIVFGEQWTGESIDAPDLDLAHGQNKLINAVAQANKKTVVVLETGGPVVMPWLSKVGAVLEAWYPGTSGGKAIARVLSGEVNPSGHLPATFPASLQQLPRPKIKGDPKLGPNAHPTVNYNTEGAAVGYKWFDKTGKKPLFPFGYGLSYTSFALSHLSAAPDGKGIKADFSVKNTGSKQGKEVAQIYVAGQGWEAPRRLGAFRKLELAPGEKKHVSVSVKPRLLATFVPANNTWKIAAGDYKVMVATSAAHIVAVKTVHLQAQTFKANNG